MCRLSIVVCRKAFQGCFAMAEIIGSLSELLVQQLLTSDEVEGLMKR